jgi:hypothetical protein
MELHVVWFNLCQICTGAEPDNFGLLWVELKPPRTAPMTNIPNSHL